MAKCSRYAIKYIGDIAVDMYDNHLKLCWLNIYNNEW